MTESKSFVENRMIDERKVIELRPIFSAEDRLVTVIVDNLIHMTKVARLTNTQMLSKDEVASALNVAFWAGLGMNEGRPTRVRLLLVEPSMVGGGDLLTEPPRFTAPAVAKLAPAVPTNGSLLISPSKMSIYGIHPSRPHSSSLNALSIFLSTPGTLQLGIGPLQPYAVVSDGRATLLADAVMALPAELARRLKRRGDDIQVVHRECCLLAYLARQILEQGHGGTMLLVADTDGQWTNSIEFAHKFTEPNTALRDYVRVQMQSEQFRVNAQLLVSDSPLDDDAKANVLSAIPSYLPEHDRLVASYAPLAAVDGALVISKHLEIIGFGAKIVSPNEGATHVVLAGPQTGLQTTTKAPVESTGGTRHQSAARFVAANHDAVAIVVSHDLHTSFMFWEDELQQVVDIHNIDWWE